MAKKTKNPTRKPAKRGPKEVRLRITEDAQDALRRLLRAPKSKKR